MVEQWLSKPLTDVSGSVGTLEVHGGELGEGVLIQVIVVFFRKIFVYGQVINVYLFNDSSFPLNIL